MLLDSLLRGVRDLRSRRRGAAGGRRGPSRAQGRLLRCEFLEERQLLSFDPGVNWATYLGGTGYDYGRCVALDTEGNALVTGSTSSMDFAGVSGNYGGTDAFVAKVSSDGTLLWVTYLGGSGSDSAYGIALDPYGNALVTGSTSSMDFAGVSGNHGGTDAFVAKVWNDGTLLDGNVAWATYLGGSGPDYGRCVALGTEGNALVTGNTSSTDFAGASNAFHSGSSDAFVANVSSDGTATTATYVGGSGVDYGYGIAIDSGGNALVTGNTSSTDFAGASNTFHGGSSDAFLRKLDPMFWEWPGIVVDPISGLTTTEGGGTATIRVALSTHPMADVTIGFSSSDTNEGTVSPASLTFTPGNWNVTQTVTVTGVDDAVYDGNVAYTIITAPAASGDPNYNGFDPADVSVTNKDFSLAPTITFGGPGDDKATGVAIDANGNVYVTGSFQNTVDFNPDPSATDNLTVVGSSTSNDFVASYSPSGAFRWAHQIGGGTTPSIAVAAGYVFVSASFTGTVDFDPSPSGSRTLTSRGGSDEFLLKLNANTGNFTWVQQIGGSGNESAGGIAMGPDGNVYLAGNTTSGTDLKFGSLRPSGSGGLYITKVNASTGQFLWATRTGTNSGVVPNSIAVDSANSIYVAGDYSSSQQFGSKSITLKPHGTWDGFLLKTDSTGKSLWADGFGAAGGSARVNGVAVDAGGSVYLTGSFNTSLDSYSNTNLTGAKGILTSAGGYDAFVLKVGSSGSLLAKQRMGGPYIPFGDWGSAIAVDSGSGLVYVKGFFYLKADFGSQNLTSRYGWWDSFVAKLKTADLSFVQTYHFGCSADSGGANGVAIAATGVYVAGTYSYWATFPAGDYHSCAGTAGNGDAYVLNLDPGAAVISGRVFADVNSNGKADDGLATPASCRVFLDANGNGQWDAGEISTYTYGEWGTYEFYGLDPGQYNVVEVPVAGWTPTTPTGSPSWQRAVTMGAGQSAVVDFGNYFATQTSTYASTSPPVAINSSGTTTMPITVSDSYRILDLNVTVNLAYGSLSDLTVTLISPNGMTRVTLVGGSQLSGANLTGTIFDDDAAKPISQGTAPYTGSFRPDVPLAWVEYVYNSNIQGQWLLEVNNRTTAPGGSFLISWSMTVVHQDTQTMGAMAVVNQSTRLTDAALASLVLYDTECPSKPARGKGLAMIPAVDLALMDLAI
jgi:subtilisin-like proprotein convertase family protein